MIQSRLYVYSYSSPRFYPAIPAVKKRKKKELNFFKKKDLDPRKSSSQGIKIFCIP